MEGNNSTEALRRASSEAATQMKQLLNESDMDELTRLQLLILGRLQDSNAVLSNFNEFSERSFAAVVNDFSRNTQLLKSIKGDLDHIFQRMRLLKARLSKQYPSAFKDAVSGDIVDNRPNLEEPH